MRRRLKKPKRVIKKSVELQEVLGLSQETKNGIWGVASLGLAVVSVLAFFGRAGQAGELFSSAAKSLFGWGIFLFVSVLIALNIPVHKLILRKEEDAECDEEMPVLKDNLVIKRGMQVITPAMQKAEEL